MPYHGHVRGQEKTHLFLKGTGATIFAAPDGRPWTSDRKQREEFFYPALKAPDAPGACLQHTTFLRERTPHGWRHTGLFGQTASHKDASTLLKHYAKWIDGADKDAVAAKLNAALGVNWPQKSPTSRKSRG